MDKKYKGFVYEWTNNINGKKYIGSHIGIDSDRYVGSGVAFRKDLKDYGLTAFSRKVLEYVEHENDLPEVERTYLEKVGARDNPMYYNKTNGSSVTKKKKHIHERKICAECKVNLQAVNYTDPDGITHYRTKCDVCARAGKKDKKTPAWYKSGYRKKPNCEKCGFKFKFPVEQSAVYYLDGNLKNNNHFNLKTVCLNCVQEVHKSRLAWKPASLVPDF